MRTVGRVIRDERKRKNLTVSDLAATTKIKAEFIQAIEKGRWKLLPEYPVVVGFVKNIFKALGMEEGQGAALIRRDYPPNNLPINPKPDIAKEFVWGPRMTFFAGVALFTLTILGYLVFQYISFISPPDLLVDKPAEGEIVTTRNVNVAGSTDPEATVNVNNQPVIIDENGHFESFVEVVPETKEVVIIAKSRSGKESIIKRSIKVESK